MTIGVIRVWDQRDPPNHERGGRVRSGGVGVTLDIISVRDGPSVGQV